MSNLRYLDLSRNDIGRIYANDFDALRTNSALETLSLSDCRLVYMDEGTFRSMNNMTSLTLARSLVNHTVFENVRTISQ